MMLSAWLGDRSTNELCRHQRVDLDLATSMYLGSTPDDAVLMPDQTDIRLVAHNRVFFLARTLRSPVTAEYLIYFVYGSPP